MGKIQFLNGYTVEQSDLSYYFFKPTEETDEVFRWSFLVSDYIYDSDDDYKNKAYNLIFEWLLKHGETIEFDGIKHRWKFYRNDEVLFDEELKPNEINISNLMKSYPNTVNERIDRTLLNYSYIYPQYGDIVDCIDHTIFIRSTFDSVAIYDTGGLNSLLEDLGYLRQYRDDVSYIYVITGQGWQRIDELKRTESAKKQGFIAMRFGDETKPIRECFKKAISESGYSVSIIDEKEHNNQIVPEIFYEISQSKFVVVDVTYPNYGAYYEAGYAQGLGKEVIVCCRKKEFDSLDKKPHFDIAQKSTVVWTDENDLVERLKKRIEATVN